MGILITGGTGLIGSYAARALLSRERAVAAYDASPETGHMRDIADRIEIVRGDVTKPFELMRALKDHGIEGVAHLASLLTPYAQRSPMDALKVNLEGTMNILEAARLLDLRRVVFASSISVYGATPEGPLDEDFPKNPLNVYGALKLASEHMGLNYYRDYGVDFVALRFPLVYGLGGVRGFRGVEEIVTKCTRGLVAKVPESDDKWELVYGPDAGEAVALALEASPGKLRHRVFNIGSGQFYSFKEVAEIVREFIPDARFEVSKEWDIRNPAKGVFDPSRARDELGYAPRYDIRSGIRDFIEKARGIGLAPEGTGPR
jgi:nucleoside-diphosphate-sugar epimerase